MSSVKCSVAILERNSALSTCILISALQEYLTQTPNGERLQLALFNDKENNRNYSTEPGGVFGMYQYLCDEHFQYPFNIL